MWAWHVGVACGRGIPGDFSSSDVSNPAVFAISSMASEYSGRDPGWYFV